MSPYCYYKTQVLQLRYHRARFRNELQLRMIA